MTIENVRAKLKHVSHNDLCARLLRTLGVDGIPREVLEDGSRRGSQAEKYVTTPFPLQDVLVGSLGSDICASRMDQLLEEVLALDTELAEIENMFQGSSYLAIVEVSARLTALKKYFETVAQQIEEHGAAMRRTPGDIWEEFFQPGAASAAVLV